MPPPGCGFMWAIGNFSHSARSQTEHRLQRPNNSFKPSPLRGLGAGSYDSAIAVAATLPGLTQALGLTHMTLLHGTVLLLEDQGEGWFPLVPVGRLRATVVSTFESEPHGEPYYLVQLDAPIEIQEPRQDTHSGLRSIVYTHLLVRSRWLGTSLGSEPQISAHVCLVPDRQLPTTSEACSKLPIRIWANCSIMPASIAGEA